MYQLLVNNHGLNPSWIYPQFDYALIAYEVLSGYIRYIGKKDVVIVIIHLDTQRIMREVRL